MCSRGGRQPRGIERLAAGPAPNVPNPYDTGRGGLTAVTFPDMPFAAPRPDVAATVHATVTYHGVANPMRAKLRFDMADPLAVTLVFLRAGSGGAGEVDWTFARELLRAGLDRHEGLGDVRVWPEDRFGVRLLHVVLDSPEGCGRAELPRQAVRKFLNETFHLVPAGAPEEMRAATALDAALDQIRGGGHGC